MKNLWETLPKPIIGLAPMEGYSDSAFRQVCKAVAEDIVVYTEFTSADGLAHRAPRVISKFKFSNTEKPIIAQIFGKNEAAFVDAAKFCEDQGFSGIDLNMGCPAKKVVKSEHGIALRRNHLLAFRLIEAVSKATNLPVSVKTRLGWSDASDLVSFGKGAESAGANMICIHARTYQEPYGVPPIWKPVHELKAAIKIPVVGNGGIATRESGLEICKNLDGFLIGQAAIGNPWVFLPDTAQPKKFSEKQSIILAHAAFMVATKGEQFGLREFRKHFLQYVKGLHNARLFRSQICHINTLTDVQTALDTITETLFSTP